MLWLGELQFDERILDAIRDKNLAVFAGAGVSMGAPANLPSFGDLAIKIAEGTGKELQKGESIDHFLGKLGDELIRGRTVQHLAADKKMYTALHTDLLRLFGAPHDVRIITTNFDSLFENAASALWTELPESFSAPALALGSNFEGLIHLHGDITRPNRMVLTDRDFGRAYLTEGWARRFLLDVFRRYTVLFVGYSHDDLVMTYLSRALPPEDIRPRFALDSGSAEKWEHLGIKQISFQKEPGNNFRELYAGIHCLADLASRGILEWKSRVTMLAKDTPPKDESITGEIKRCLGEVPNIKFFVAIARDTGWPEWLDNQGLLDSLFDYGKIDERSELFARWLADAYVIPHPDSLLTVLAKHGTRINPAFWRMIASSLGQGRDEPPDANVLATWVSILLSRIPDLADSFVFLSLCEQCARVGKPQLTLQVFLSMCSYRVHIENWHNVDPQYQLKAECLIRCDEYSLEKPWKEYISAHLEDLHIPLLEGLTTIIGDMYQDFENSGQATTEFDPTSYRRSAIEPHAQDEHRQSIDVLIDAIRDTMEWFAHNQLQLFDAWIEMLYQSPAPLLRRMAMHAIGIHPLKSGEDKIAWILERSSLYSTAEYHEIHRTIGIAYASATEESRRAVVDTVLKERFEAYENWNSEERTLFYHFKWLDYLLNAKPDCPIALSAIAPIKTKHPEWKASEQPDLTHWSGPAEWVSPQSPLSVDAMIECEPAQIVDTYANYKGDTFNGPDRSGFLHAMESACKQNANWAGRLAAELVTRSLESLDFLAYLLRGYSQSEADAEALGNLFDILGKAIFTPTMARELANLLYSLVKDDGKTFALDLLDRADTIALRLWNAIAPDTDTIDVIDWLSTAINHPAGILAEYWVDSLSVLINRSDREGRILPDNYKQIFAMILEDTTRNGDLARTVLCSQFAFLYSLDSDWTSTHILVLYRDRDNNRFSQAWNGFLTCGRLNPLIARVMVPVFIQACGRVEASLPSMRDRFADFYAALAVFYSDDPSVSLLPKFLDSSSIEARGHFAHQIGFYFRNLDVPKKQQIWDLWLKRYLENRIQCAPSPLSEEEVSAILGWLPYNAEQFEELVELITHAPRISLGQNMVLYQLNKDGLAKKYQESTAELIIYLCKGDLGWHENEIKAVASQLTKLPPDLKQRLNEALARKGLDGLPG